MRPRSIPVSRGPAASFAVLGVMVALAACSSFSSDNDDVPAGTPEAGPVIDGGDAAAQPDAPAVEADVPVVSRATVLAMGYGKELTAIAATETAVYFADGDKGGVYEVPLEGGLTPATRYTGNSPTSLAVAADGTIYFAEYGQKRIGTIALNGVAGSTLTGGSAGPVAIALGNVANMPLGAPDSLVVGALVDATPTSVFQQYDTQLSFRNATSNVANIFDVAAYGADVYWTDAAVGSVFKGSLPATGGMVLASSEGDCQSVAVDADGVYWTRPFAKLVRMKRTASAGPVSLATNEDGPRSVTSDKTGVYWMTADGKVRRSGRNETPAQTIDEGFNGRFKSPYSRTLAVTSKYLVWITGDGKVLRLAKPQ